MERYIIVIGDDPETALKKYSAKLKNWKESQWLYNGITMLEGYSQQDLIDNILADKQFLPSVILDNGKWMDQSMFAADSWEKTIAQCLGFTTKDSKVTFYTFQ